MCYELIVKCKLCGIERHYGWERCREHHELLEEACIAGTQTPHPSECDQVPVEERKRVKRDMTVYECPVEECKSTGLAKMLFEKRAKEAAEREAAELKARLEFEARKKRREDRFARRYFRKIPQWLYAPHLAKRPGTEETEGEVEGQCASENPAAGQAATENSTSDAIASEEVVSERLASMQLASGEPVSETRGNTMN